ncbi:hypothetical protein YIM_01535 [Amycolatopsis sp. YIM 10]|nr:hypothetical protein YIM_01535 [Amycolatopsis sp. YIM 10]
MRIRFARDHRLRPAPRTPRPGAGDADAVQQRNQLRVVSRLARGEQEPYRQTTPVNGEVDLRAQSAAGPAESFSVEGEGFDLVAASPFFSGLQPSADAPDHAGIDRHDPLQVADGVVLDDHPVEDLLPGAVLGPPPQPFMRGLPRPVASGQVTPWSAGAQLPQDRVDHLPVVPPPPPATLLRWQQRLDHSPRLSVNSPRPTTGHNHQMPSSTTYRTRPSRKPRFRAAIRSRGAGAVR